MTKIRSMEAEPIFMPKNCFFLFISTSRFCYMLAERQSVDYLAGGTDTDADLGREQMGILSVSGGGKTCVIAGLLSVGVSGQ